MKNIYLFIFVFGCSGNSFNDSVDSSQHISEEFNYNIIDPKQENETNEEGQYLDSPLYFRNDVLKIRLIDYTGNWNKTVDFSKLKLIESDNNWNIVKKKYISEAFGAKIYYSTDDNLPEYITLSLLSTDLNKDGVVSFYLLKRNENTYDKIITFYKDPPEYCEGEILNKIIYNGKVYDIDEENLIIHWQHPKDGIALDIIVE